MRPRDPMTCHPASAAAAAIPFDRSHGLRVSPLSGLSFVLLLLCFLVLSCFLVSAVATAEDWPQWRGANRDGVWRETGLIDAFAGDKIPRRWSAKIGSGYSGPTVAVGRVFVMDRLAEPEPVERIHCFDRLTGEPRWSHVYGCSYEGVSYTAGPRASVTIHEGLAYAIGSTGHLHCLDAVSGEVAWERDLRDEFRIRMPTWGIAASPLIEGDLVILQIGGEGDACVIALDRLTGKTRWQALSDDASYASPIMIEQAGRRLLVVWTGERVVGMNPVDGTLMWDFPYHWEKWPIGIATPVHAGEHLLISEVHKGSLLLRLGQNEPRVDQVWHRRDNGDPALHALMSTPLVIDGHIYGADESGILRCLELETGEQLWQDDSVVPTIRWATVHLVRNRDRVWMFNDRGELIITRVSPDGLEEISRSHLLDPTTQQLRRRDGVTWSHPAYAHRHIFARNDEELVCADLSAD